ncbi:MAG: hypothetical protein ACRYF2_06815 [Janthinobacterium lividum]
MRLGLGLNRPCCLLAIALPKRAAPPFAELRHALEASLSQANGRAFLIDCGAIAVARSSRCSATTRRTAQPR